MDKNMINIDDFMRQRLSDAEGQGQPDAAWLNMKQLLDQEMPSRRVPIGFNWKRMFGYIAGLVLLAALSVGGYQMIESQYSTAEVAANKPNKPGSNTEYGVAGIVESQMPGADQSASTAESATEGVNTPAPEADNVPVNNVPQSQNVVTSNTHVSNEPVSQNSNSSSNKNLNIKSLDVATASKSASSDKADKSKPNIQKTSTKTLSATPKEALALNSTKPAVGTEVITNIEGAKEKLASEINNNKGSNTGNKNDQNNKGGLPGNNENQTKEAAQVAQNDEEVERVPIKKIVRHETYTEGGKLKMDTIFNGKDVMEIPKPKADKGAMAMANASEQNVTVNSELMPQASASANKAEDDVKMERLADHRVKVKKAKKAKNYDANRFEEMVQNTKYRMGQMRVYPGLIGGLNAAAASKRVVGFQAGLACNISVSDRWSILTEAKYIYRFNSSANNLQNDFIRNIDPKYVNNTKVYTYDSVEHYYNFSNYGSVELPIALSYDIKRFNVFAGANLRYNFKINNIAEIEQVHLKETPGTSTNSNFESKESTKKVLLSDFGSTFNVGYVFGVGFQAAPAVRLDLRCTQPFWNNAKTDGQKELSRQLYNTPQLQFNIMYRFSSNRPYKKN